MKQVASVVEAQNLSSSFWQRWKQLEMHNLIRSRSFNGFLCRFGTFPPFAYIYFGWIFFGKKKFEHFSSKWAIIEISGTSSHTHFEVIPQKITPISEVKRTNRCYERRNNLCNGFVRAWTICLLFIKYLNYENRSVKYLRLHFKSQTWIDYWFLRNGKCAQKIQIRTLLFFRRQCFNLYQILQRKNIFCD